MLACCCAAVVAEVPRFVSEETIHTQTGSLSLEWQWEGAPGAASFEIQRAGDERFVEDVRALYSGPDRGTYLSGMLEGDYYFRMRGLVDGVTTDWSQPLLIVVEYPAWREVLVLFGLGILVFAATLTMVIAGYRITQRGLA